MEELKCSSSMNQGGMNPCMGGPRGQKSTKEKAATVPVYFAAAVKVVSNEDLLTEILSHLPAKSLFRFKLVSKNWLSLISNPRLCLLWKPKPASGLLMTKYMPMDDPNYNSSVFYFIPLDGDEQCKPVSEAPMRSLDFIKESVQIIHSCNGLLLCRSPRFHRGDYSDSKYYICNPLTKQYTALPRPQGWGGDETKRNMNLAVDVSNPTQYRVVAFSLLSVNRSNIYKIEIYSSVTRTWRLIGETLEADHFFYNLNSPVFWNSAIHWPEASPYFHVDRECTGLMPLCIGPTGTKRLVKYFGESNGHLHLVYYDYFKKSIVVMEMESDYSNWFLKYSIDVKSVATRFIDIHIGLPTVLSVIRKENEDESFLVLYKSGEVISINFASGICQKLCDLQLSGADLAELVKTDWKSVNQYIETPFWV